MGLNKKLVKKWIHALESGEYAQGKGCMRETPENGPDQFCCLGVLCDTISKKSWSSYFGDAKRFKWKNSGCAIPPETILNSVGLADALGKENSVWDFAFANDGTNGMTELGKFSFTEIAEILRMEHNIWS